MACEKTARAILLVVLHNPIGDVSFLQRNVLPQLFFRYFVVAQVAWLILLLAI